MYKLHVGTTGSNMIPSFDFFVTKFVQQQSTYDKIQFHASNVHRNKQQ